DLTFIEDGNDDMITNTRLINFAKRQRTAGTIRDLQQFQNVPYNLTPVAEIQDWLLKRLEELCPNGQSSDRLVEEFWKMSTTLEPKEKDSERVLRLLKESGFL
ncbi:cell division cycle- protein, partial [Coemansia sp. RSA 2703]